MGSFRLCLSLFTATIGLFGFTTTLFCVYFMIDSKNVANFSKYQENVCYLSQVEIYYISGCGYVAVWKNINGLNILENPFSVVDTQLKAQYRSKNYPLNTTFKCFCDATFKQNSSSGSIIANDLCNLWTSCYLDIDNVKYIQNMEIQYVRITELLVIFTSSITGLFLMFTMINCICGKTITRYCNGEDNRCCYRIKYKNIQNDPNNALKNIMI